MVRFMMKTSKRKFNRVMGAVAPAYTNNRLWAMGKIDSIKKICLSASYVDNNYRILEKKSKKKNMGY